jgi:hypothetical protein
MKNAGKGCVEIPVKKESIKVMQEKKENGNEERNGY